jgi:RNA polymerase sigma-70 factor (ECF subfamily)
VTSASTSILDLSAERDRRTARVAPVRDIEAIYVEHGRLVWRTLCRLGVAPGDVDDAVQEVFLIVHRRLHEFEARSSLKTWLFAVARNVAMHFRDKAKRSATGPLDESLVDGRCGPHDLAEESEAVRALYALLEELDDEKRTVFILAELEQWSAPEIATAVGVPLNTVYSRLRAARAAFNEGLARMKARDAWRAR